MGTTPRGSRRDRGPGPFSAREIGAALEGFGWSRELDDVGDEDPEPQYAVYCHPEVDNEVIIDLDVARVYYRDPLFRATAAGMVDRRVGGRTRRRAVSEQRIRLLRVLMERRQQNGGAG